MCQVQDDCQEWNCDCEVLGEDGKDNHFHEAAADGLIFNDYISTRMDTCTAIVVHTGQQVDAFNWEGHVNEIHVLAETGGGLGLVYNRKKKLGVVTGW